MVARTWLRVDLEALLTSTRCPSISASPSARRAAGVAPVSAMNRDSASAPPPLIPNVMTCKVRRHRSAWVVLKPALLEHRLVLAIRCVAGRERTPVDVEVGRLERP